MKVLGVWLLIGFVGVLGGLVAEAATGFSDMKSRSTSDAAVQATDCGASAPKDAGKKALDAGHHADAGARKAPAAVPLFDDNESVQSALDSDSSPELSRPASLRE